MVERIAPRLIKTELLKEGLVMISYVRDGIHHRLDSGGDGRYQGIHQSGGALYLAPPVAGL
jgi:hypothetical protein